MYFIINPMLFFTTAFVVSLRGSGENCFWLLAAMTDGTIKSAGEAPGNSDTCFVTNVSEMRCFFCETLTSASSSFLFGEDEGSCTDIS